MLLNWLNKHGLSPKTGGKNVGRKGWINIRCPFCGDSSNHLGISPTGGLNCWRCQCKTNLTELVKHFERCSWKNAKEITDSLVKDKYFSDSNKKTKQIKTKLPKDLLDEPLEIHKKYLKSRGFNVWKLIEKYNIKFTGKIGQNRFSIFVPIYGGEWIYADCTRKRIPYVKSDSANQYLYNIEKITTEYVFLVEGLIDCWRFDESDTIPALGDSLSNEQINLIVKKFEFVYIIFDGRKKKAKGAEEQAINLGCQLDGFIDNRVFCCDYDDPGNMTKKQIKEFKRSMLI